MYIYIFYTFPKHTDECTVANNPKKLFEFCLASRVCSVLLYQLRTVILSDALASTSHGVWTVFLIVDGTINQQLVQHSAFP